MTSLKNAISKHCQDANYYSREVDKILGLIGSASLDLELLHQKPDAIKSYIPLIQAVTASGFFEYSHEFSVSATANYGKSLVFITKEVLMTYKHEAAGIDIKDLSMGRFQVRLNCRTGQIKVLSYSMTKAIDGHIHPHISSDNFMCWGNSKEVVSSKIKERDFAALFPIIETILKNYNPASPYVALHRWDILKNPSKYKLEYKEYSTNGITLDYKDYLTDEHLKAFVIDNSVKRFYARYDGGEFHKYEVGNYDNTDNLDESCNLDNIYDVLQNCVDDDLFEIDEIIFKSYRRYRSDISEDSRNYFKFNGQYYEKHIFVELLKNYSSDEIENNPPNF